MQREYPEAPLVGVGAVVFDQHWRVLLVKRGSEPQKGHWSLPGGLIELGESLTEAIAREVAEETGLVVEPMAIVEVVDRIYKEDGRVRFHYVIVDYWCNLGGGMLRAASDADEVCWATSEQWRAMRNDPQNTLSQLAVDVIEKGLRMAQTGVPDA